jgi:exodeoxyribonuclease-5
MALSLSPEQERARAAILSWYRSTDRKPWFLLEGSAGTGKSSCITATTESIPGEIVYLAPTAKAALVMASKGCPNPQTIHSAIYNPKGISGNKKVINALRKLLDLENGSEAESLRQSILPDLRQEAENLNKLWEEAKKTDKEAPKPKRLASLHSALKTNISNPRELIDASPLFERNPESFVKDAALIVMDECSMISTDTMNDIMLFGVPVLLQGDRYQLPPVGGKSWFLGKKADFTLTQVHRQAADSPIIYLATLAREGKPLPVGYHGDCLVTRERVNEHAVEAEQIILGTHQRRWAVNDLVRKLKGFTSQFPEPGERVICRHNDKRVGVMNGEQFTVRKCRDSYSHVMMSLESEDGRYLPELKCHKDYFFRK